MTWDRVTTAGSALGMVDPRARRKEAGLAMIVALLCTLAVAAPAAGGIGDPGAQLEPGGERFVDCLGGDDGADGRSPVTAWRSLDRAGQAELSAGQRLLLKRECIWEGRLTIPWSGVTVAPYGSGAMPLITNGATAGDIVDIEGDNNIVAGVAVRATSTANGYLSGFNFSRGATGNTLAFSKASGAYAGVYINEGATRNAVTYNRLVNNRMINITSRDDSGAFGVLIWGNDNEVSYNRIDNNVGASPRYGQDGAGVEVYNGSRNRIHHNRAANNAAFTELGKDENKTSDGNVFAYNLVTSTRPGSIFLITRGADNPTYGPVTHTRAYNNVVHFTGGLGVACARGCDATILTLKNNIISADTPLLVDERFDESNNVFWKKGGGLRIAGIDPTSKIANPRFVAPGTDFHLRSHSPAIDAGTDEVLSAGFAVDLDGRGVPSGAAVDIGAYELAAAPLAGRGPASPL
jgi:hypothetical protein